MRLGRLLAGAGDVGRGWRATEEDIRVAHNNQLDIEARNRLEALRRIQMRQQMANAPNFSHLLTEGVQRDVIDLPGEPGPVAPGTLGSGITGPKKPRSSSTQNTGIAVGPFRGPTPTDTNARGRRSPYASPDAQALMDGENPENFPASTRIGLPVEVDPRNDPYYQGPNPGGPRVRLDADGRPIPLPTAEGSTPTYAHAYDYTDANDPIAIRRGQALRHTLGGVVDTVLGWGRRFEDFHNLNDTFDTAGAFLGFDMRDRPRERTPEEVTEAAPAKGEGKGEAPTEEQLAIRNAAYARADGTQDTAPRHGQGYFYRGDPQIVSRQMQDLMQQRERAVGIAQMYQQAGMGEQYTVARLAVEEMDQQMFALHGDRAIFELGRFADPRRLEAVWSHHAGVPMEIHPRSDGTYDVMVQGQVLPGAGGLSVEELSDLAQRDFSETYREQVTAIAAERDRLLFASDLRIRENTANQNAQMVREIYVARNQDELNRFAAEAQDNDWTLHNTPDGYTIAISPDGQDMMAISVDETFREPEEGEIRGQNAVQRIPANFAFLQRRAGLRLPNGQ